MRREYEPMLASLGGKEDLHLEGYTYEPKLDGTRAVCYVDDGMRFINRRGREITERYPEFTFRGSIPAKTCVLDGEVVVYDKKGNPSFSLLQKREQSRDSSVHLLSARHPATYVVFDILESEGRDLTSLPLDERRRILERTVNDGPSLQRIVHTADGTRLWSIVEGRKLEGVMAKRSDSPYEPGRRSRSWIKIKALKTLDCVIIGFTSEKRSISALALGIFFDGEMRYMGRVGTGFTDKFLDALRQVLDKIVVAEAPVHVETDVPITWVRPELVAEVEYLQLTGDGHLRAPSFRRLRTDKAPRECTSDTIMT